MRLLLIVSMVLVLAGQSRSQQPTPTPAKPGQTNQGKAGPKQSKTESNDKSPEPRSSAVDHAAYVAVACNQANCGDEGTNKSSSDWGAILITIFTGALALLAYFQWDAMMKQAGHMRKGLELTDIQIKLAGESARAAATNAEALMAGERAWLLIDGVDGSPDFAKGGEPQYTYRVVNFGKTPGFVSSAKADVQVADNRNFPSNLSAFEQQDSIVVDNIVAPKRELTLMGNEDLSRVFYLSSLSDDERNQILANPPSLFLWAVGSIHYYDVFNQLRHAKFAYWYNVQEQRFERTRFPGLNSLS